MGKIIKNKSKVIKKENDLIESIDCDVCVVGAGSSGFAAAIEAARLGKKVVLVDSSPILGGQAINSVIGLFCGLYSRTKPNYLFTYGLVEEMLRDLHAENALYFRDSGVTVSVAYDEQALLRWVETQVMKYDITAVTGASITDVKVNDRRVESIEFVSRYGRFKVDATGFVDASGDAALIYNAGLPCRVSDVGPIYGTQMIIVENVDFDCLPSESEIKSIIKEKGPDFGLERHDGIVFHFPTKDRLILNMTHILTPLNSVGASMEGIVGKRRADRAYDFIRKQFPEAMKNSTIHAYGQIGIRQTRWIVGKKQLLAQEVRDGIKFEDSIARTTWPIELHDTMESYQWEPFDNEHVHYVPFGSMTPPDVDNLIAVGRCIDADLIALSSVRVMGPCMAMGMAAAHVFDLIGDGSVHDFDIKQLQSRVSDNLNRKDSMFLKDVHKTY
ncbi:FAD dependent oxidoreductase [Anaerovirgula multivorans]|uniref:FAD dependent oxidoreductase n=1 Tax=Anaerovirgula multivorans TaxID=312168 RepID=A0A239K377_9FIRM|nr:FAD-dependent oxidoreductase [Anaerovirgula multivorans]SNT12218.1 FAD dependent oxidoreductase [Anaerovirgula multivorans]